MSGVSLMSLVLILVATFSSCSALKLDKEYFTNVVLKCSDDMFNNSQPSGQAADKKYWMLPSGELLAEGNSHGNVKVDGNFSLELTKLDDDNFGWYYCLMVHSDLSVDLLKYGINVDGPYYGDLISKYKHNAMIGGIAAAILFVFLAGSCLLWHLRFHNRNKHNKAVDDLDKAISLSNTTAYDNVAMEMDKTPATNGVNSETLDQKF